MGDNQRRQKKIRAALAQTHIVWEDKERNYKTAEERLREAARQNMDVVFFPEMSFTGFSMNTDATKERGEQTIQRMKDLVRRYDIGVGFGWVKDCTETCGKCENHYTVVDRAGAVLSDYAKLHPFSCSGEDVKFQGGSELTHFVLNGIPFSSFICYDLRFPEIFQAASRRAHMIVVPANWPAKRSAHWKALLQARAIENQIYLLAVNCVGETGSVRYTGDSCVVSPDGKVRTMLPEAEGMLFAELEDDAECLRAAFPVRQDRREALYASLYEECVGQFGRGCCTE